MELSVITAVHKASGQRVVVTRSGTCEEEADRYNILDAHHVLIETYAKDEWTVSTTRHVPDST